MDFVLVRIFYDIDSNILPHCPQLWEPLENPVLRIQ